MPLMPAAATGTQRRDPAARGRLIALLLALVVLWPMLQTSGFSLAPFFDSNNLKVVGGFLAQFLPPETSQEFLAYLGQASLETLAIATAGMALALFLALPLWLLVSTPHRSSSTSSSLKNGTCCRPFSVQRRPARECLSLQHILNFLT